MSHPVTPFVTLDFQSLVEEDSEDGNFFGIPIPNSNQTSQENKTKNEPTAPEHPLIPTVKKALIHFEREWWNLTSLKLRLEQLSNSVDEDFQKESRILERLNKMGKYASEIATPTPTPTPSRHGLLTLIQFSKVDSLQKAGIGLKERLTPIRVQVEGLKKKRDFIKKKLDDLLNNEGDENKENTEKTETNKLLMQEIDEEDFDWDEFSDSGDEYGNILNGLDLDQQ